MFINIRGDEKLNKEQLIEIIGLLDVHIKEYQEIKKYLNIKEVDMGTNGIKPLQWCDEKDGQPITTQKILDKIIKDLNSISNVIYELNKTY